MTLVRAWVGSSGAVSQEGGFPCWGMSFIWAALAWPLNRDIKTVVCLLCLCTWGLAYPWETSG